MNIGIDYTEEDQQRIIGLEARMRGVTQQEVKSILENKQDLPSEEEQIGKQYPSRNESNSQHSDKIKKKISKPRLITAAPIKKRNIADKKITAYMSQNHKHSQNHTNNHKEDLSVNQLESEYLSMKEIEKELRNQLNSQNDRILKYMDTIKTFVLENELLKRQILKIQLGQQRQRLGEMMVSREGTKFNEVWVDGFEMSQLKKKLKEIERDIDACKEDQKKKKSVNKNEDPIAVQIKLNLLLKDEDILKKQLEMLENEKKQYLRNMKRQNEEEQQINLISQLIIQSSLFGRNDQWPVLGERYQILSFLGRGGFSEVYKGYDLIGQKEVACKLHQLNPQWNDYQKQSYIKHAIRENRVHNELRHPNIVQVYDTVEINDNQFCTVMEYCDGTDLSFLLKKHKYFSEKEAKLILIQLLSAIKYLNNHANKIIHYDLKPQNILLKNNQIKITDFGLCKVLENDETKLELTSQGVGTYWYLPPECFQTDEKPNISSKVDVWAIGCIFYEMIFGQKPFGDGYSQEKILKDQYIDQIILHSQGVQFPSKVAISQDCKEFIKAILNKNQRERLDIHQACDHSYISHKK